MVAGWEVIGGISFLRGRQHILKELITELRKTKIFLLAFSNDCLF
uniref:Uncharacterized protein n=1 Tax=Brassica oleracea TaxID=3712 RepID=A0A3P6EL49_BRAOL|nr:unnamed protein product [Brassica oleracea]